MTKKTAKKPQSKPQQHPTSKPQSSSKPSSQNKTVHKERGWLLTTLLVLIAVHAILAPYIVYVSQTKAYTSSHPWVMPILILVSIGNLVGVAGMFLWKTWGYYVYLGAQALATSFHIVLTGSVWVVFYDVIPVAILAYVINQQNKWKYFD
jgi:hypothetical protein